MATIIKKRNNAIDVISAIFILEIVIQHIFQNANLYGESFYSRVVLALPIFMPWFYFKAGLMFSKPRGIKDCIKYRTNKLLRPFAIWSIIPSLMVLPFFIWNGNILSFLKICASSLFYAHGVFNTPLWFLASLFLVYIVAEIVEHYKIKWGGVIVCSAIISFVFYYIELKLPLGFSYLPLGVFCFGLGKYYSSSSFKLNTLWVLLLLVVHTLIFIWCPSLINFHKNELSRGVYQVAVVDIIVMLTVCYYIIQKEMKTSVLSYIGRNSMIIFVAHAPVLVLVNTINDSTNWFDPYCLLWIFSVGIIVVCSCLLKWKERLRKIF